MNSSIPSLLDSVGLKQDGHGFWYAAGQEDLSYPSEGNDQCFEIEDKSFWFQHRNACIIKLAKKFPPRGNRPIFDVGGGDVFFAEGRIDAARDMVPVGSGPGGRDAGRLGPNIGRVHLQSKRLDCLSSFPAKILFISFA